MAHQMNPQMQQCIQDCLDCYRTCLHDAMNHCLETGGKHVEPAHFRLMINCAEICRSVRKSADVTHLNLKSTARVADI